MQKFDTRQQEVKVVFVPLLTKPILYDSARQANFFTLSSFGVTQFINGKPEFSELEQWKREVRLSSFEIFRAPCMADCTLKMAVFHNCENLHNLAAILSFPNLNFSCSTTSSMPL